MHTIAEGAVVAVEFRLGVEQLGRAGADQVAQHVGGGRVAEVGVQPGPAGGAAQPPDGVLAVQRRGVVGVVVCGAGLRLDALGQLSRVAVVPVCMYPETFRFDQRVAERAHTLDSGQSSASVRNFRSIVGEFCGLR